MGVHGAGSGMLGNPFSMRGSVGLAQCAAFSFDGLSLPLRPRRVQMSRAWLKETKRLEAENALLQEVAKVADWIRSGSEGCGEYHCPVCGAEPAEAHNDGCDLCAVLEKWEASQTTQKDES